MKAYWGVDVKIHVFFTTVLVGEPITEILGGSDLFINRGSTINLTCLVKFAPEPPPVMLWSHNRESVSLGVQPHLGLMTRSLLLFGIYGLVFVGAPSLTAGPVINFDSPRGGISLVTEKGPVTTSRLLIQKAIPSDTGLYTCDPSNANPASVRVHILNGKEAASILSTLELAAKTDQGCSTVLGHFALF
ncbi:hypothetical protein B7P43_G03795 [Cryptotermes secundus]|uniref:Ig-like domain-containing protein n=1 Tax=Cryptotermes secundus TaxID=105785 RepID=A0A2J7RIL5_9NEOP|nr:hypothetical protein B7P43_G03795 [Cryptotermes secundus]